MRVDLTLINVYLRVIYFFIVDDSAPVPFKTRMQ